jgi:acyl carrier protein
MLSALGDIALHRGLSWLDVAFVPTAKNRPASDFLDAILADLQGGGSVARSRIVRIPAPFAAAPRLPLAWQTGRAALEEASVDGAPFANPAVPAPVEAEPAVDAARFASIAIDCWDAEEIHRAISARSRKRPALSTPFIAPRSALEHELTAIWAELLGVDQIGVNDNFFDLGGHSLTAMQLISRVRVSCNVELSLRSLFSDQFTIAILARMVTEQQSRPGDREDIEALLSEINALTDEEVLALLAKEGLGTDRTDG